MCRVTSILYPEGECMKIIIASLLLTASMSAPAILVSPLPAPGAPDPRKETPVTTIDGRTLVVDDTLPREQRLLRWSISRASKHGDDKHGDKMISNGAMGVRVATTQHHDDAQAFTTATEKKATTSLNTSGVSARFALADFTPQLGRALVVVKDGKGGEQYIDMAFNEGETVKTVGDVTIRVQVKPF